MGKHTFTPGPWEVRKWRICAPGRPGFNGGEYRVADAYTSSAGLANTPRAHEAEANARLIAASPDLLAVLEALLPHMRWATDCDPAINEQMERDVAAARAAYASAAN